MMRGGGIETTAGEMRATRLRAGLRSGSARVVVVCLSLAIAAAIVLIATARTAAEPTSQQARDVRATTAPKHATRARAVRTRLTKLPPARVTDATSGIAVRFNGTVDLSRVSPKIAPATAGHWQVTGDTLRFVPVSTLAPCGSYTLTLPAGLTVSSRRPLGVARTFTISVACPSVSALQEALARLGYLPYTLKSIYGIDLSGHLTRALAAKRAYVLPHADLRPNASAVPALTLGTMDPTTIGALEVYEQARGMAISTTVTSLLWQKLLADEVDGRADPRPYTWVTVSERVPETLQVHEGTRVALQSLTNTGVPGATTQQGIFPIYIRYVATTMIGTNVDGSHYDDPGVPWVNYFNGGDAVHGYVRPSYGTPQSNGCVELPIATAQKVYGMLELGDIVVVS